jgi:hypothetical protein
MNERSIARCQQDFSRGGELVIVAFGVPADGLGSGSALWSSPGLSTAKQTNDRGEKSVVGPRQSATEVRPTTA